MAEQKFFWLKLKRDFFKRHDIKIVEAMPNGKDYILFYMKLLLESIDHEGALRFSDTVPFNDQMLSVITDTNIDVVRSAIKVFNELRMIEILDDGTIYMCEVSKMIGSETAAAERKRAQRERERIKAGEEMAAIAANCDNVTLPSQVGHIEIEKEKEKDIEKKSIKENPPVTFEERLRIYEEARKEAEEKRRQKE